ncbi:mitochondrial 54S ribosomal protein YmL22 [Sugiyamaella lignohabitans]|uniref:Mitochondrial 54S ribosomal protein YmL22 n=1 Tax=Sugiyamaella lignohabitans TaxID=796027 RepID=A0A167CIF6_9ASCO|nr:mitochondrial 54S ribosomal protein YmL22 [Sugiyamaella lignohabitans]ANB11742.1 mitochondrial 54S ribosomal protein YmL22 [Sugiyamaella lignohabitans]
MSWLVRGGRVPVNGILRNSTALSRGVQSGCGPLAFNFTRGFTADSGLRQKEQQGGSLFGEVSEYKESADSRLAQLSHRTQVEEKPAEGEEVPAYKKPLDKLTNRDLLTDPEVQEFVNPPAQTAAEKLLSPLKRELYTKALELNGGKYVPNQIIKLDNGKSYQLNLTKEELQVLTPSVYLHSYRIKSSLKKTYVFLRMLRGMDLNKAITQCHFSPKHVARDVGEMLTRGLQQAKDLKLDPNELYVEQIWVGKDGTNIKRLEFKGRGRVGTITHKWVHVKAILRHVSYREEKTAAKVAKVDNKQVWQQLKSRPVHYVLDNTYKW